MKNNDKGLTLKALNKSNVWDIQENDVFRLWEAAEKEADVKDNARHYTEILRTAFEIEEIKVDRPEVIRKYEARGFQVGELRTSESQKGLCGIKKKPISRVTDLTYENITHISSAKLIEVLDRNFGGGWESLSQSIQDIILSGFEISTTTLPANRLRNKGGMYEKKVEDGFEVLEIPKGSWVEAIFAKAKPKKVKAEAKNGEPDLEDIDNDEELPDSDSSYNDIDEDDEDAFDNADMLAASYMTTIDEDPDALSLDNTDIADEEEF